MLHNGKGQREHEPCNGDYLGHEKAAYHLPDCANYLTGRECDSGGNVVYQVKGIREWAAAYMPAALSHIIERRCLLWQKRGKTTGEGY